MMWEVGITCWWWRPSWWRSKEKNTFSFFRCTSVFILTQENLLWMRMGLPCIKCSSCSLLAWSIERDGEVKVSRIFFWLDAYTSLCVGEIYVDNSFSNVFTKTCTCVRKFPFKFEYVQKYNPIIILLHTTTTPFAPLVPHLQPNQIFSHLASQQ